MFFFCTFYKFSNASLKSHRSKGEGPNFKEKTPSTTRSERPDRFSNVSLKSHRSKGEGPNFKEKTPSTTRSDLSKGEGPNFSEVPKRKQWQTGTVNIGAEITRWKNLKQQKNMDDVQLANYLLNWVQHETPDSGLKTFKYSKDLSNIFQELEQIIIVFFKNELDKFKKIIKKENTKYFVKDFEEARSKIKEAALEITLYFLRQMKKDKVADDIQDELISIHQRPIKRNLKKRFECVSEGIAKHGDSTSLNKIYTELYITEGEQVNAGHDIAQIQSDSKRPDIQEKSVNYTNVFKQTEEDKYIRTVLTKGVAGIGKSVSVQKFVLDWAEEKVNKDITFIFPLPFREINFQEKDKLSLMDLVIQYFPETKGMNLTRNDKFKILFIFDGLDECRLPLKFEDNEICRDVTMKVPLDVLLTNLFKGNLFPSALIWITSRPAAASKIPPECIDRVTEVRGFNDEQKQEYFRKKIPDTTLAEKIIKHVKESKSLFIMCHIPVFCWISATVLQNILEKKSNQPDDTLESPGGLDSDDTPQTLTQMYTHFFRFQILQSSRKYDGNYGPDISWEKGDISLLGNLAFQQLKRNNLIFYYSDLEESGINVSNATAYSGMFTQIFKEETGMRLETTFSFVHMSFQEFVAALYAHLFLDSKKTNVFAEKHTEQEGTNETMFGLLKTAVNKALESDTGHLDLFLRFLLGLSLKSNRPLLRGLLTQQDQNGEQTKTEIVKYIKQKLNENLSPERSINLFYCLHELNDQTLVKEIQDQLNSGSLSSVDLSPAQWSALAFVLVTSDVELEDFELQKFKKSDECLRRLEMVVKNSKRALLNDCNLTENSCFCLAKVFKSDNSLKELNMNNNSLHDSGVKELCTGLENVKCKLDILRLDKCDLTEESCSALASVLGSDSTSLKELDLSNNKLQDSGVKLLSDGLQKNSTLEILRLSNCSITEEGYKSLASALKLNPSHLTELDLTGNDPGESGVKMLTDVQQHQDCTLKTLRFLKNPAETALKYLNDVLGENLLFKRELDLSKHELRESGLKDLAAVLEDKHCKIKTLILNDKPYIREEDCAALASAFISNPSNLIELDLSRSKLKDSGIKCFSTLFENLQCKLKKLKFNCVDITKEGCTLLASALNANPSHLRELDLTGNKIEDCGVTEISTLLKNSECRLEKLRLSNCSITEEGYKSLALALESNPSHLTELDLRGNDPGESGVKMLIDVKKKSNYTLKKLRLLKSSEAEKGCQYVMNVVHENPLLMTELKLTRIKLTDTKVKHLAALLEDKHCKLKTIQFDYNGISESGCADLLSAFNTNPSNLKELDLSGNQFGNAGIEKISTLLKNSLCRLEKLKFSNCGITENGYKTLALALKSNPSHLTELNLTENDPGDSGVKMLIDAQKTNQGCKLQTIRFLKSPAAEEACKYLTEVLDQNPLLLTELDLSDNKLGDLDGNNLSALLMDSHSRLVKIRLNNCDLTEKNCSALAAVLSSNTILKEIDLNDSCLPDSGVKQLCEELKMSKLKILKLSKCGLEEEDCSALASVLGSDSTSLKELDLSNNELQDSGVKLLSDGLQNNSTLKILRLSNCSITEEGYKSLALALSQTPHT
nr:NLR family CARD domain-containing protein 3-like isoform X2 [Misgurnus anguillicaudatus]